MDEIDLRSLQDEMKKITKILGLMCVTSNRIADQSLSVQARILKSVGFSNIEIAELLNSTPNSIGVRLTENKSWRDSMKSSETSE